VATGPWWAGPPLRPKRSTLRAPMGCAQGRANDKDKTKSQKGKRDTSKELRKWAFLKSLDSVREGNLPLASRTARLD